MLINRLTLKNLLSFIDTIVELGPLNVLIGPNAVGKSNLIEAIGLLQAAPTSLANAILRGGGIRQWLWLGGGEPTETAEIECALRLPRGRQFGPILYDLQFAAGTGGLEIVHEFVASATPEEKNFLERSRRQARFGVGPFDETRVKTQVMDLPANESVLSQYKNPADPTPVTEVGKHFAEIKIYREFRTGPQSQARFGISTSGPKDTLSDGGDNLALVLQELDFLGVHGRIGDYLSRFCERFEEVKINLTDGLARPFLREAGLSEMISAVRMSDGTLKFLALLAALFHPSPPPLMCIEEPETGLHPDALQLVAEALVEASESMQLIVTTHSEALVDALTDRPETVLVCERDFNNGTQMKRLSKEELKEWLTDYTLGQLWRKGEIGGGRW